MHTDFFAFPASFSQQRLWFLDQLNPGTSLYNVSRVVPISGLPDVKAVESALQEVLNRHETLRTRFPAIDGRPYQLVSSYQQPSLRQTDLRLLADAQKELQFKRIINEEAAAPFDLARGPLVRSLLLLISNTQSFLHITMHHAITDGWSMEVLSKEITTLYETYRKGKASPLSELPLQFGDYAAWQKKWLSSKHAGEQLAFWKEKLSNPPTLELPWDRPRGAAKSLEGAWQRITFSRRFSRLIYAFARKEGVTLFMTLLAAFQTLLARLSSSRDILIGTPVAGRTRTELEGLIGFFVNTLPLRIDLNGNPTLREVVQRAKAVAMDAFAHQEMPFDRLVSELAPERSLAYNPLVQVLFALQNVDGSSGAAILEEGDEDEEEAPVEISGSTAKFDLTWTLTETDEGIMGQIEYSTALINAQTIQSWVSIYKRILEVMITNPETRLDNFSLLTPEQYAAVQEWNQTDFDYPRNVGLGELFLTQAACRPEATALIYGDRVLRYRDLDELSFYLAQRLLATGVQPGDLVGVCFSPSPEWITSMLAIVRCGAAYVPLDPSFPEERIRAIGEAAGVNMILTPENIGGLKPAAEGPLPAVDPEAIAYVMYTSGSTGLPKGVSVPHRAIIRLVSNTNYVTISPEDRIGQASNPAFDAATFEVWGALLNGATVVGIDRGTALAPQRYAEFIAAVNISILFVTTPLFNQVAREVPGAFASLKHLLFGGEAADAHAVRAVIAAGRPEHLLNVYGPTETTTFATFHEITELDEHDTTIPIGRPVGNTQVYVLNEQRELQPAGVPGELYIGGDGLATGYLHAAEITAERFVEDRFRTGKRLYRTGDNARYRADGIIEFLGRKDQQVKIRGFRVEPGEIELTLLSNDAVREAVVHPFGLNGSPRQLVGYIVWEKGKHLSATDLRSWVHERLPDYMVPTLWKELECLPLNNNGKVDRLALPAPDNHRPHLDVAYQEPKSKNEQEIASIWAALTGTEKPGVHDNFFELGGHSLLATQVVSRIRDRLGVDMPVRVIFERPTIAALAEWVARTETASGPTSPLNITRRNSAEPAPLSFSQQRLWFLDQLDPDSYLYNMHSVMYLSGDLNLPALERSVGELIQRHEVLRTRFATIGGVAVQVVNAPEPFGLTFTDLSSMSRRAAENEYQRKADADAKIPFNLEKGPLFRLQAVTVSAGDHRLIMTMHHAISDGWSLGVLHKELEELYTAFSTGREPDLPILQIQYADFAIWQRQRLQGEELAQLLAWWQQQLLGAPPVINLPTDYPRPLVQTFKGATQTRLISVGKRKVLEELGQREGATLFITLLTAWYVLLYRFAGEDDIVIGTPIANRTRSELEPLIGFFVNTLLIRINIPGNPTYRELLRLTRNAANEAYAHQDLPFERLVAELAPERRLSHTPLFQCFFALQNQTTGFVTGLQNDALEPVPSTSMFDLSLTMLDLGEELAASFEYSTELFAHETITRLMEKLERLLTAVADNPDNQICSYNLMSEAERNHVLFELNDTAVPYPRANTVVDLFEQRVACSPHAIAVAGEPVQLTYKQLNASANQLAGHFVSLDIQPGSLIGFALDQGPEMIITILGILKAGCAYVPLDAGYPKARLALMMAESNLSALVTFKETAEGLPPFAGKTVLLDEDEATIAAHDPGNTSATIPIEAPAYVIYTSGSTGQPKGVVVGHSSLLNYVEAASDAYEITERDRVLQFASIHFDASVEEIYPTLARGGTLVLRTEMMATSISTLFDLCTERRVSVMSLPTAFWHELVSRMVAERLQLPACLRLVIIGGDRALPDRVRSWQACVPAAVKLVNTYGPTEATVVTTMYTVTGESLASGELPIGKPVRNARVYVLDAFLQPVPLGVRGELWIAGDGLAKGYLHRQELTGERFLADPFTDKAGGRMYRTGDVVRWDADGELRFCGRADRQVKVRGYRIELGEIENVLNQHEAVKEAVVIAHEDAGGNKRLIAYVVHDPRLQQDEAVDQSQQVSAWEAVFDDLYEEVDAAQEDEFYIKGWDSSYTGEPIPPHEVQVWMDQTVDRILSMQPRRIREIGCGGSGLMLFRIAPHTDQYTGTDLSDNALRILQHQLDNMPHAIPGVNLLHRPAHLQELEPASVDAVLIVSVAQYFPTIDYLIEVIQQAVEGIAHGGFIFIGDVRNHALLEAFHTSVQLYKAAPSLTVAELKQRVRKQAAAEKQLTVDPAFFHALARHIPKITAVETRLLRGRNRNELTRFRYDLILHIGKTPEQEPLEWQLWNPEKHSIDSLRNILEADPARTYAFSAIPNARVIDGVAAVNLLHAQDCPEMVNEIINTLSAGAEGIDPEELWQLAGQLGIAVDLTWPGGSADGSFDAVFSPTPKIFASRAATLPVRPWHEYANDPKHTISVRKLVPELRSLVTEQLPGYMLPAQFVILESLPLTPTGKLDKKALPKPDRGRPGLEENFTVPRSSIEETIARIWAEVLDVEKVGIHDNFFELGGDSILSIQVIARATEAGLRFTPKQLFQHQTIADLAPVAGEVAGVTVEQEAVTGTVPLTPIQHWFFNAGIRHINEFIQSAIFDLDDETGLVLVRNIVDELQNTHDAFRLRYAFEETGWRQFHVDTAAVIPVTDTDLSLWPDADQAINTITNNLQKGLQISTGPVARVALLKGPRNGQRRLLFVAHHLVVDGVSWRILQQDVQTLLAQARDGMPLQLPLKTTSFQYWARRLQEYAQSAESEQNLAFWVSQLVNGKPSLPLDVFNDRGADNYASSRQVNLYFTAEETRELLQDVPRAYRTQINDVLLAALAQALSAWTGNRSVLLDLEGHGREPIFDDVDLSRTVGWFTSVFPVMLDLSQAGSPGEVLRSVKEQLRRLPGRGLSFGVLKYLSKNASITGQLTTLPQPQVCFNYLGQFGAVRLSAEYEDAVNDPAPEMVALTTEYHRGEWGAASHILDINGGVENGKLWLTWSFSTKFHRPETIEAVARRFATELRALITHCKSAEARGYSASDFPLAKLDQEKLDWLVGSDRQIEDIYSLSPMQEGMLFHSLYDPEGGEYIEQSVSVMPADLNVTAFRQAWQLTAGRHSILRTGFAWSGLEAPLQIVRQQVELPWQVHDWSAFDPERLSEELDRYLEQDRTRGFDLGHAPLMRFALFKSNEDGWIFLWTSHHILLDGWSQPRILSELHAQYEAIVHEQPVHLEPVRPFRHYIEWLHQQDLSQAEHFWRQALKGFTAPTPLLPDERAGEEATEEDNEYLEQQLGFGVEESAAIDDFVRRTNVTANTAAQAAWALLLSSYSRETDVLFGTTVAGRPADLPGVERMVGLFINTIPVRVRVKTASSVSLWLKEIQRVQANSREFEHTPLVQIQGWSEVERGSSLFDSLLVFENYPDVPSFTGDKEDQQEVQYAEEPTTPLEITSFPLTVAVVPGRQWMVRMTYESYRFTEASIRNLLKQFRTVMTGFVNQPEQQVGKIRLLSAAEHEQVLSTWNNTAVTRQLLLAHEQFEAQAANLPGKIAVDFSGEQLSYGSLNDRANRLACQIHALHLQSPLVAIYLERSIDVTVAVLGALKAGAGYVPLDPAYPADRLAFMLEDAAAPVIITQSHLAARLPAPIQHVLVIDQESGIAGSEGNLNLAISPDATAYVIYTSGSTGRPKGVVMPHGPLANLVHWQITASTPRPGARTLQFAPLSFDVHFQEMFSTWAGGGTLILLPEKHRRDAQHLLQQLVNYGVDRLFVPFVALQQLAAVAPGESLPPLLEVITAGEQLKSSPEIKAFFAAMPQARLHNHYGPTETHVVTSFILPERVEDWPSLPPIGKPIDNARIYLVNENLEPVPVGIAGQLYIGGEVLALGYLNLPGLTAERFIKDPFSPDASGRLYATGDLARYLPDGNIAFLGRTDFQVKVRGFRIEPGELETVLGRHPGVRECMVDAREDSSGDKKLVAYIVPVEHPGPAPDELRTFMLMQVPEHMVPAVFMMLAELPVTPSGKVDRKLLPAPDLLRSALEGAFEPPQGAVEEQLAAIYADVLQIDKVGAKDNFFELGGHSLMATRIISRIRDSFHVELALRSVFESPTVTSMAAKVTSACAASVLEQSIPRRRQAGTCPLSYSQQRLWFLEQLQPGTSLYNVSRTFDFTSDVKREWIEGAVNEIVRRHEALRTTFVSADGKPYQLIAPAMHINVPLYDLRRSGALRRQETWLRIVAEVTETAFDLSHGPLLRAAFVRLSPGLSTLVVAMHHIITDGWSMENLAREIRVLYQAFHSGQSPNLPDLPIQYADYAAWQRHRLEGEASAIEMTQCVKRLAAMPLSLELPFDRPRPALPSFRGATVSTVFPPELSLQVLTFSRERAVTPFTTLLACFNVLLSRLSGCCDIAIGTPTSGRTHSELEHLIGFFVNTLIIRSDLSGNPGLEELLRRVESAALAAFDSQAVPFDRIVAELAPERHLSHHPLVQVMFDWQNAGAYVATHNPDDEAVVIESTNAKFDLTLTILAADQHFEMVMEFSTDVLSVETIQRWSGLYLRTVEAMVNRSAERLETFSLLTLAERSHTLVSWNDTVVPYTHDASLYELFSANVEAHPDHLAVSYGERNLTYRQLDGLAGRISAYIGCHGINPGDRVAVQMDPSPDWIAVLLGIVRCGATYVPLDNAYPEERRSYVLRDAEVRLVMTDGIMTDLPDRTVDPVQTSADHIAYVMYTSGSTGQPKGVMITHRAIVRLVLKANYVNITPSDRIAQASNPAFDASTFETWGALLNGATIVGIDRNTALSPLQYAHTLLQSRVSILFVTTALFNQVAREVPSAFAPVEQVMFGGETADPLAVQAVLAAGRPRRLMNMYGPTETTTFATFYEISDSTDETAIPIGFPVTNRQTYVLDNYMQPQPVGVRGEIYIGGDGVAAGYLNEPALTEARFLDNPFADGRLYKTGDLGRYRADGSIEFLGRKDHQLKIRGFRVEPGEIESALLAHPFIREVLVQPYGGAEGSKQLVAYLVFEDNKPVSVSDLRLWLKKRLPAYMIPAFWIPLEGFPMTPSGKINRLALPEPDHKRPEDAFYTEPVTRLQSALAAVWSDVLRLERVGLHDNFFELGGHSLLAMQVVSRLRDRLGIESPVRLLFEHPTVADLAVALGDEKPASANGQITPRTSSAPCLLSFAQQRIWFLEQIEPGTPLFNMHDTIAFPGGFRRRSLEAALSELVRRHEILRTSFTAVDGVAMQIIAPAAAVPLPQTDLSAVPRFKREEALSRVSLEESQAPFALHKSPLFRARLVKLSPRDHRLLLTMHHIISDGWSLAIIRRELETLYGMYVQGAQFNLAELPVQYADFSAWQHNWLASSAVQVQLDYWKKQLSKLPPVLEIPLDRERPATESSIGARQTLQMPSSLAASVRLLCHKEQVTPFMMMLTAFEVILHRYTGQTDLVIGCPVAGRTRVEMEALIGCFLNTLVMRVDASGNPTFRDLLSRVRQTALDAFANQEPPFEKLVQDLAIDRSSKPQLFRIFFNVMPFDQGSERLSVLSEAQVGKPSAPVASRSIFDLTLYVFLQGDTVVMEAAYRTDLFKGETISRLLLHMQSVLDEAANEPDRRLSSFALNCGQYAVKPAGGAANRYPEFRAEQIEQSIGQRFEAQARRHAQRPAVRTCRHEWSYAELHRRASAVSSTILKSGIQAGERVVLLFDHDAPMLAGLFGTILAGGVYIPLDPSFPRERHSRIIHDSDAACILTDTAHFSMASSLGIPVFNIEETGDTAVVNPRSVGPDHLAYILYTSGSTGQPKGVVQNHRNVLHHCRTYTNALRIQANDRVALISAYGFDAAVMDIFGALLNGATLSLFNVKEQSPESFAEWIMAEGITVYHSTPTIYRHLLSNNPGKHFAGLRCVVLGGEEVVSRDFKLYCRHFPAKCVFVNGLGPTECTLALQYFMNRSTEIPRNTVPVGFPVKDMEVLLLEPGGAPICGCGTGELAFRSRFVAVGYWKEPELTVRHFMDDAECGLRIYRTGDLAQRLPDGRIEFLGRKDQQVKIRGVRVEPGEIESRLLEHADIKEAVVTAFELNTGDRHLAAYIVPERSAMPVTSELRDFLRQRLPETMLPTAFVTLEVLPLTPNGKLDRNALPVPENNGRFEQLAVFVAPVTPTELSLASIWSGLLRVPDVSVTDNFFELGGHSLLATQLASRVRESFYVDLALRSFFTSPTLGAQAKMIDTLLQNNAVVPLPGINRLPRELYRVTVNYMGEFILPRALMEVQEIH